MTEQFGNQQCQCHQCTTIRWKNSLAGHIETATTGALNHPLGESSQLSRLREGLRELAEKLERDAIVADDLFDWGIKAATIRLLIPELRALLSLEGDKTA